MTREKLVELVGDIYDAEVLIDWVLGSVTEEFVKMVVRAKVRERKSLLEQRESNGYYDEFGNLPDNKADPLSAQWRAHYSRQLQHNKDRLELESAERICSYITNH